MYDIYTFTAWLKEDEPLYTEVIYKGTKFVAGAHLISVPQEIYEQFFIQIGTLEKIEFPYQIRKTEFKIHNNIFSATFEFRYSEEKNKFFCNASLYCDSNLSYD
ncbi:hypothetical protein H3N56_02585 [Cetobacterium sp. 2A]|uniref:hypothetical protein n=1 Tax=Cetobacterium sp. 2A TaxID=2754723 RepID=UPI00163B6C2A|nr:hypothetical protein [Cetobacterium sp. 2A]MBC2855380.1 hypothetical protein [Cetobacterium sp. 2A]